jgi:Spy/CpxP family protein refolding chaperone
MKHILLCTLLVAFPALANAQSTPRHTEDVVRHMTSAFDHHLISPEIIMQYQQELDITDAQRKIITDAILAVQSEVLEMQWRTEAENRMLAELLEQERIDRAVALEQLETVLELERKVKRAHMSMLITVKNALTAEQQTALHELRHRLERQDHLVRQDTARHEPGQRHR